VLVSCHKECEKELSKNRLSNVMYEELMVDVRTIHLSKSVSDYKEQQGLFKTKWDNKVTKDVYTYMNILDVNQVIQCND